MEFAWRADFVIAFATGFAFSVPTAYPLVLVPGFLVPIAVGFICIRFESCIAARYWADNRDQDGRTPDAILSVCLRAVSRKH
jgi:hypothetical protein